MLSCVARGQEELEIKSKELELKLFLLEEQLESEGTQPLTRLPDALRSDRDIGSDERRLTDEALDPLGQRVGGSVGVRLKCRQQAFVGRVQFHANFPRCCSL